MSLPELNELKRAEELFKAGKLDNALKLFNDTNQYEGLNLRQKGYFQFLKGLILLYQSKHKEAVKWGEELLGVSHDSKDIYNSVDAFSIIFLGLILDEDYDTAWDVIEQTEDLLTKIFHISKKDLTQRKVRINVSKAWIYMNKGNIELAQKCLEWAINSEKEVGFSFEIVWANLLMAQIALRAKNKFDLAIQYTKKAKSIAKNVRFNQFWIAMCHLYFGVIYQISGELDDSFEHNLKSLKLFKTLKSNFWIANILNDIGLLYGEKGEYALAYEHLEESLVNYEIHSLGRANCLNSLIYVALEKGDTECAQNYFNHLENTYNQKKDNRIEIVYLFTKALLLKKSPRIRDKAKAEELLKRVIETKTSFFTHISIYVMEMYKIYTYIHLCDLLLSELLITNNNAEVLHELKQFILQLLTSAENSHSYLVFCEAFILKAKLALVNLDLKAAQRYLTQSQKIAESRGIKRLAMKISYEHDELLKQSKMWKNLKESDMSFSERWKLAGLKEQMKNMVEKRIIEVPELSDEQPVLLLIITEGGTPFFSQSFIEEKSFESHLFGGFLTTIDYFIKEMFSEGLERAVFGEHTLLMKSLPPFFITYIFKGNSYYALKKINYFRDYIQKNDSIWSKLLKYFQSNQSIRPKDFPLLDSLITEIFITKSVRSSEL